MKIVAVSDVTLGYGTPQLPLLAECVGAHYGGEVTIVEPVQPELTPRPRSFRFRVHSVPTAEHPHSPVGRTEYIWRASRVVNAYRPDVLIICCTYSLPLLYRLERRPRKVIYYSVESIPFYGTFDVEMNRRAESLLDVVLFPEENRAVLEVSRCRFNGVPKLVLYNVSNRDGDASAVRPRQQRNGRLLYSGTISREQTFADYYLSDKVRGMPIDLFGPVKGTAEAQRSFLAGMGGNVRYGGYLPTAELAALRPSYIYSIVAWNPSGENQLYAAPNKFFESIADGVPPIAAPHPQCKVIIERYGCGLLMDDWGLEAFVGALRRAVALAATPEWDRMVSHCEQAVRSELTWDAQFAKVKPYL